MRSTPTPRFDAFWFIAALIAFVLSPSVARADDPKVELERPAPTRPVSWRDGGPIPEGFHVEEGPFRALYIPGGAVLLGGYVAGLATGFIVISQNGNQSGGYAAIPLVGPFLAGATYKAPCEGNGWASLCTALNTDLYQALFYSFGAIQAVGAVLFVTGLNVQRKRLVRNAAVTVVPVPFATRNAAGLALAGAF
jgi:hypothetical protein